MDVFPTSNCWRISSPLLNGYWRVSSLHINEWISSLLTNKMTQISKNVLPAPSIVSHKIIVNGYHPCFLMDINKDTIFAFYGYHPCLPINIKRISKDALPASLHRLPGELRLHRDCPDVHLEQDWRQIKVMLLANFGTFMGKLVVETFSQGIVFSTRYSAPSMSRLKRSTRGFPRARRRLRMENG